MQLTDQGIGPVSSNSQTDAYMQLTTLLGAPSVTLEEYCNGVAKWASWDGLSVFFQTDGPMLGWSVDADADVKKPLHLPLDVQLGQPLGLVLDQGGRPEPITNESFAQAGQFETKLDGKDGYAWISATPDRDSAITITMVSVYPSGCN